MPPLIINDQPARGGSRIALPVPVFVAVVGLTDAGVVALVCLVERIADRIAVGPRRSDVPRLDKLTEGGMAQFCRVLLVGIWPGLALLAGAGVWLLRRR